MPDKRPPSAANVELADWVTAQGFLTTPREIRTWREAGWVVPAEVSPQGYARPTVVANPPEAFGQALAVATVRGGKRTSPQLIAFGLFARGYPIDIEPLREAWKDYFEDVRSTLHKVTGPDADAFTAGEELAAAIAKMANRTKPGRYMLRNAKKRGESAVGIATSALTVVFTGLFGGSVDAMTEPALFGEGSALDELHQLTGMAGFVNDKTASGVSIVASHDELRSDNVGVFEQFTLDAIELASQETSLDILIECRNQTRVLLRFTRAFARSTALTAGPATSYGMAFVCTLSSDDTFVALMVLLVAILNAWMPGRVERFLPMWTAEAERNEALLVLLDQTPRRFRKYLVGPWVEVPDRIKPELTAITGGFRSRHPELVEKIMQPGISVED
jgi:hypothetical protein